MKTLVISVLLFVFGFSVNKYVISANSFENTATIADTMTDYPVDLIEFKQVLEEYMHHVCENNDDYLKTQSSDVDECITEYEAAKNKCTHKVFRLAPLKIQSKSELKQYGQDYKQCTLPYKNIVG